MTRLILTLVLASMAVAAITVGTLASFSDTEGPGTNTLDAGTLDLKVGGNDVVADMTFTNIKPGDTGLFAWQPSNAGTINGELAMVISALNDVEEDETEPEVVAEGCVGPCAGPGELSNYLEVVFYQDVDETTTCGLGDIVLYGDAPGTVGAGGTCVMDPIQGFDATNYPVVGLIPLGAGADTIVVLDWHFTSGVPGTENDAQGDETNFDITFNLYQEGSVTGSLGEDAAGEPEGDFLGGIGDGVPTAIPGLTPGFEAP